MERSNSGSTFKNNNIPNEPSFYHDDVTRYMSRFEKHISERQKEKKLQSRTHNYSCLNYNTNTAMETMRNNKGSTSSLSSFNDVL